MTTAQIVTVLIGLQSVAGVAAIARLRRVAAVLSGLGFLLLAWGMRSHPDVAMELGRRVSAPVVSALRPLLDKLSHLLAPTTTTEPGGG